MSAAVTRKGRGEFFTIDRRTWNYVCGLSINEAATYLTIAQGTDRLGRFSKWSTTSLRNYLGISYERGTVSIGHLINAGAVRHGPRHTKEFPHYELPSWSEVFSAFLQGKQIGLNNNEKLVLNEIKSGAIPGRKARNWQQAAKRLYERGLLRRQGYDEYSAEVPDAGGPDLLWLPNTIVTGTERGEHSPVRRLRTSGDLWTLRLLVDLYHAQNLRDDGGVSPAFVRQKYERKLVGQQGRFAVWAFKPQLKYLYLSEAGRSSSPFSSHECRKRPEMTDHPVWETMDHLQAEGLLDFVPHLWERDCTETGRIDAEPIHAYGLEGIRCEPHEVAIGTAAQEAAVRMASDWKIEEAWREGYSHFAPVRATIRDVQLIGIARLTYRPRTLLTSSWYRESIRSASGWINIYAELRAKAEASRLPRKEASFAQAVLSGRDLSAM